MRQKPNKTSAHNKPENDETNVGMIMIGQHGRSVLRIFCGAKAIPTSLLVSSSPRNN